MFTTFLSHPRTTAMGVLAILTVISKVVATGHVDLNTDGAAIMAGVGLIFAHDGK